MKKFVHTVIGCTFLLLVSASYIPFFGYSYYLKTGIIPLPEGEEVALAASESIEHRYPAHHYYHDWNTNSINPYEFKLSDFEDTIYMELTDSVHCPFNMPVEGRITSNYGYRRYRIHHGIDIDLFTGDPVKAAFDGVVRFAKYAGGYGYAVVIRHYNGLETVYAHLSKIKVKPGDQIEAGDVLGLGGNTGRSTGSHLHFEVRFRGWSMNPKDIISFEEGTLVSDCAELVKSRMR